MSETSLAATIAGMGDNGGPALDNADDLLDINQVRKFWGGEEPINAATVYRMIANGTHPKPMKIGKLSRWFRRELIAERDRRLAERDVEAAA